MNSNTRNTYSISEICRYSRAFFLISIVSAHIGLPDTALGVIRNMWSHLASIGVIGFLLISSFYYRKSHYGSLLKMLKRKAITIGVPWLFCGSTSYLYKALLSRKFSLIEYVKYLLGNGSYLYYLTILMICFIVFYYVGTKLSYVFLIISVFSIICTASGIAKDIVTFFHITNYLNIFNWLGYFSFGQILQKYDEEQIVNKLYKYRFLFIFLFFAAFMIACCFSIPVGYFSYIGWAFNTLGALFVFSLSSFKFVYSKLVCTVAKGSFSVYLIHFMIIGLIDGIYNKFTITQAIAPFLVIAIAIIPIQLIRYLNNKVLKTKWIPIVIGLRE